MAWSIPGNKSRKDKESEKETNDELPVREEYDVWAQEKQERQGEGVVRHQCSITGAVDWDLIIVLAMWRILWLY